MGQHTSDTGPAWPSVTGAQPPTPDGQSEALLLIDDQAVVVDLNDDAAVLLGAPRLALLGNALPALVLRLTSLPDLATIDPRDTGTRSGLL